MYPHRSAKLRDSTDRRLRGPSSAPGGPFEQRRRAAGRDLSFALTILSLYSSYANRLLTFVKIKRRRDEEHREEDGERERRMRRAARKQSSSLSLSLPLARCPQLLLLLLHHLLLHLLLSTRHPNLAQHPRDRRSLGNNKSKPPPFRAKLFQITFARARDCARVIFSELINIHRRLINP